MAKISIIGPSKRFYSGLSACTICLANALSKNSDVSAVLLRDLLPKFLYPGRGHVGREDYALCLTPEINVYDGVDWNSPLSWFRAYRFLKQQKPDAIIVIWWTSSVAHMQLFLTLANRLKIKAKVILEMHEILDPMEQSILPIRFYSRIMARLLMRQIDAFVVHSDAVAKQVVQTYHLKQDKLFIIPHGLFDVYYQDYDYKTAKQALGIREEFIILYFGTIRRYKGIPYLIEAFNELPGEIVRHSRLVIAGEDWGDERSLRDLINRSPHKEKITFQPQFVPDSLIPKYFSVADVVVLPYLRTSGSGVANIAMSYGKPIITSNLETMRECMMDYKGAVFVPPHDSTAIGEKLVEIHSLYISGKVMVYAPPHNTWDEVAKQFGQVIKQLSTGS